MSVTGDHWGADENDEIVDTVVPKLIRMLGLCEDVLDKCGSSTDMGLSTSLNIIDVQGALIDALTACRQYEKQRNAEIEGEKKGGAK